MELWRAAHLAELLRGDSPIGDKYEAVGDFVNTHSDWIEAFVLLYHDAPSVGIGWFT